jgi:hypothetical protein
MRESKSAFLLYSAVLILRTKQAVPPRPEAMKDMIWMRTCGPFVASGNRLAVRLKATKDTNRMRTSVYFVALSIAAASACAHPRIR